MLYFWVPSPPFTSCPKFHMKVNSLSKLISATFLPLACDPHIEHADISNPFPYSSQIPLFSRKRGIMIQNEFSDLPSHWIDTRIDHMDISVLQHPPLLPPKLSISTCVKNYNLKCVQRFKTTEIIPIFIILTFFRFSVFSLPFLKFQISTIVWNNNWKWVRRP